MVWRCLKGVWKPTARWKHPESSPRLLSLSPRGISRIKRYPSRGANAECLRVCGPSWSTRVVCKSWKIEIMIDEGHGRAILRYEDIVVDLSITLICCDVWSSSLSSHLQSGVLGQPVPWTVFSFCCRMWPWFPSNLLNVSWNFWLVVFLAGYRKINISIAGVNLSWRWL